MKDDLSELSKAPFGRALEELEELMAQSGRALLLGAGCSVVAGLPTMEVLTQKCLSNSLLSPLSKTILSEVKSAFAGAPQANIEDFLSELVDLLAIADRLQLRSATSSEATLGTSTYDSNQLRTAIEEVKRAIAAELSQPVKPEVHWGFVRAIHRPRRPGRSTNIEPVTYLVLNYDTLIEDSLALEKIRYTDGLGGGPTAWWNPSQFDEAGYAARVLKLHGSIDWYELLGDPLPRRLSSKLTLGSVADKQILIWPASTKYRETQRDPFAQIRSLARAILRPPANSQVVLAVCGYSFGDTHVNFDLDQALRESQGRLTIVVFSSDSMPTNHLKKWLDDDEIGNQVRVYARGGFFHGKVAMPPTSDLPWWKFENVARLLGGER